MRYKAKSQRFDQFEIDVICREYPIGGCKAVQLIIDRTSDAIRHKAKSLQITRIPEFRNSAIDCRDFMEAITPKTSYLLGMIWGDGHVRSDRKCGTNLVSITLAEEDFNEIKYLLDRFAIVKVKKQKESWKQCWRAQIHHKVLVNFLKDHDFLEKSYISPCKILNFIPEYLRHYFFRGWFDADGSNNGLPTRRSGVIISGSYNQDWAAMESLCKSLEIDYTIRRVVRKNKKSGKINRHSVLCFGAYRQMIRFRDYLYQGEQFGLSRKKSNFFSIQTPLRTKALHK